MSRMYRHNHPKHPRNPLHGAVANTIGVLLLPTAMAVAACAPENNSDQLEATAQQNLTSLNEALQEGDSVPAKPFKVSLTVNQGDTSVTYRHPVLLAASQSTEETGVIHGSWFAVPTRTAD